VTGPAPEKLADRVWFTTTQAATYAGVHRETILRAVAANALKSSQAGPNGWRRYHRDWLDDWMANLATRPVPRASDGRLRASS